MAFCPYCGKQLNDGEVCSCALTAAQTASRPTYAPQTAAERPVSTGASYPAPPTAPSAPQQSFAAPQSASAPIPNYPTAPQSTGTAPQTFPAHSTPTQSYNPPHQDYTAPQQNYGSQQYPAPAAAPVQKKSSALSDILIPLLDRVKLLLSPTPDEAIVRSIKTTDMSWGIVYGAYVLLGTLAASFAIPKLAQRLFGGYVSYGDMLGEMFGGILWRSLLMNIITLAIAVGTVMGVCAVTKAKLPFARALNLVSIAFVPAVALNALGFLFSFFFPAGTLICGLLSAICTIVMLCVGIASLTDKKNMWLYVIITSALVLIYTLVLYIFMDGMVSELLRSVFSGLGSMFW